MSPRPDVSEERRAQILEAATVVFAREGFLKARMDDVAEEAGLSKGTLYWYFKSKDELAVGIVGGLLDRELNDMRQLSDVRLSAREYLLGVVERITADFREMQALMSIIYEFIALAPKWDEVAYFFKKYFRDYMDLLIPIIKRGIENGEFRAVDPMDAAIAIGAQLEGTILLMLYDPESVRLEYHLKTGIDVVLNGLCP